MKITVLMENTAGRPEVTAEHGLSLFVETPSHTLLLDTGHSPLTWENAKILGVDIRRADTVVLTHGHYDHTGGLLSAAPLLSGARIYARTGAFGSYWHGEKFIGANPAIRDLPGLILTGEQQEIDSELLLFSGVTGRELWPAANGELTVEENGVRRQDPFTHEQDLLIRCEGKQVLLCGCAHCGIVNILKRCRELTGRYPDVVAGGFHFSRKTGLSEEEREAVRETAAFLADTGCLFYTGHCTGEEAFGLLLPVLGDRLRPMHAGDVLCL